MSAAKIFTIVAAGLVAFALFGLTYSATVAEDGVLRATSFGVIFGLVGFSLTFIVVRSILDMGK